jgi:hypothetical protein
MNDVIGRLEAIGGVAAPGDWLEVVARAERHRSRTLRRRLVIAFAVALLAVPTIAIATGHWNLFSLTATDEEIPLPEGEAKLGYVVGDELRLPGRPPAKLAKPVGAYLGSQNPLVVPSPDGRTLVYHAWEAEFDRRRGLLKSATNFLRVFDVASSRDRLLERGAAGVAWRRDGTLAYLRATEPELRNTLEHWKGARFGHVLVRRTPESRPVRWTSTEAAWVPLVWAGRELLVQSTIKGVHLPGGVRRFPWGVWAFSGPGRVRPLGIHTLVAVSPDGRFAFGVGSRDGSPSLLRVVEPSTGRIAVSVDIDELPGAQKDGIERDLLWLREGSWSGDTIIAASGSGSAPFQFPLDFNRPETLRQEGVAGLTVLRYSDGKLSVERTLKLTGAVAEATGIRHRYSMFEFVHPIFVDSTARQFTSELRIIPNTGRSHFLFVTCDIEKERCRRGRLRKPFTTRAALVYNPSRPLPD